MQSPTDHNESTQEAQVEVSELNAVQSDALDASEEQDDSESTIARELAETFYDEWTLDHAATRAGLDFGLDLDKKKKSELKKSAEEEKAQKPKKEKKAKKEKKRMSIFSIMGKMNNALSKLKSCGCKNTFTMAIGI